MIKVKVENIEQSKTSLGAYTVNLIESKKGNTIPILVGGFEAQSIAIKMENVSTPRPLTHDLIKNILDSVNKKVKYIEIEKVVDGVFYSNIVFEDNEKIDARTSDAIVIALTCNKDIFIDEKIIEKVGYFDERFNKVLVHEATDDLMKNDINILEKNLKDAIENEDYEKASEIKEKINNIKK
jgi:bifunctional DNase/RNase